MRAPTNLFQIYSDSFELEAGFLAARAEIETGAYDFGNSDEEQPAEVRGWSVEVCDYNDIHCCNNIHCLARVRVTFQTHLMVGYVWVWLFMCVCVGECVCV